MYSNTDPGQPWISSSGRASDLAERACTKWIDCPSTSTRYWLYELRSASCARQSNVVRQYSHSSCRYDATHPEIPGRLGEVVDPAGSGEPRAQIVELVLGNRDGVRGQPRHANQLSAGVEKLLAVHDARCSLRRADVADVEIFGHAHQVIGACYGHGGLLVNAFSK